MVTLLQPLRAVSAISVTEAGIRRAVKPVQLFMAYAPIWVIEFAKVNSVKCSQSEKAYMPMLVTLSGILTLVKS